jgi:hypothetical protein
VLSHRGQNLVDDGASFGVNSCSTRDRSDRRSPPANDLLSANHNVRASQDSYLPRARAVRGACAGRSNIRDRAFERRNEPPPTASERYEILCIAGPSAGRSGPHDVACAHWRRTWRRVSRRFLHCAGDKDIKRLQGLIVKELFLGLSGNSSLCLYVPKERDDVNKFLPIWFKRMNALH